MSITAGEVREDASNDVGCLGKAQSDEPVFVLRAQDVLAPDLVELWAIRARTVNCPFAKVNEAFLIAQKMREWPNRKSPD